MQLESVERELAEWREQNNPVIPVIVAGPERQTEGVMMLESWTKGQRLFRALRIFIVLLVVAALSALIPILHFVLVPLFLVIACLTGSVVYSRRERMRGGVATCPECGKSFPIFAGASRIPFDDRCTECNRHLRISLKAER